MEHFFSLLFILIFSLFPLLLWGYGSTYLSRHVWNRARFFAGLVGGVISIGVILLFRSGLLSTGISEIMTIIGVFLVLGILAWIITLSGSIYIQGFLRNILLLHISIFIGVLLFWGYTRNLLPVTLGGVGSLMVLASFFLSALLEEGVKHISSIGLTARNFRFSRTDFLYFTFFVTLGFVTIENILYFYDSYSDGLLQILIIGIYRIVLALPLHVFAASICVIFWWKALSYSFISWKYIMLFLGGFLLATLVHSLYNYLIAEGFLFLLGIFSIISYFVVTQWFLPHQKEER